MKTFEELKEAFEEPGEFLLVPGEEMTTGQKNPDHNFRYDCHLNIFNLDQYLPPYTAEADDSTIVKNCCQIYREAADKSPRHSFIMLNHPFWRFWDVDPCVLLDTPEIRFFEVCNNDVADKSIENPLMTVEKFWDFVLAHRIDRNQPLLYATATDDTHYYNEERYHVNGSYAMGWVMVNCPGEFTADAITDAMLKGDFYPTSGVLLESIEFSAESKTLQVKVKEEAGVNYRIEFITTRKDFDRTVVKKLHKFNDTYTRYLTIIPDNIGQSVKTVEGSSASYTMNDDELYVRAIIYSDKPGRIEQNTFYPAFERAWTQPF